MPREPFVFLELRRGFIHFPVHLTLMPMQHTPHFTRISIRPIGIHLTWDALAHCGFGAEDIICLCKQETELLRHEFTPTIAPGYVRFVFSYITNNGAADESAYLELVISQKVPYRTYTSPHHSADIIPLFSHSYGEDVG